jgi:hypothetical protein
VLDAEGVKLVWKDLLLSPDRLAFEAFSSLDLADADGGGGGVAVVRFAVAALPAADADARDRGV